MQRACCADARFWYARIRPVRGLVLLVGLLLFTSGSALPLRHEHALAQISPSWREIGPLHTARCCFTATLLADGRVLVAGGSGGDRNPQSISSAEIYNPATAQWTLTNPMHAIRQQHSATLLRDGRVLIAGGVGDGSNPELVHATAEIFDPATNTWSMTGALSVARANHFAVLLPDGRVLVGGGYTQDTTISSVEIYDPTTSRWSLAAQLPWDAQLLTATLLRDGTILAAGGFSNFDHNDAARYDPATDTWIRVPSLPTRRATHSAELLPDGRVLLVGYGLQPAIYQPLTNSWNLGEAMSVDRHGPLTALLANGLVLVSGGQEGFSGRIHDSSELFDPTTDRWLPGPRMHQARLDASIVVMPDRSVLAIGGQQNGAALRSVEQYGPVDTALPLRCTAGSVIVLENGECTLAIRFQQVNASASSFALTVESSDPALLPSSGVIPGGSGTARTLTIRPAHTDARVSPTRQGNALVTVTATDGTATEQVRIPVNVISPPWLVMLYLNGDDAPLGSTGSQRLESIADAIVALRQRLQTMPFNPAMRLVVVEDRHDVHGDSRVYVRDPHGLTDVTPLLLADRTAWPGFSEELNTADPATVQAFVGWARSQYPGATFSFLSLVDHGGGWAPDLNTLGGQPRGGRAWQAGGWRGMSIDFTSGGQSMSTKDTGTALQGLDLDVIFFDACFMGMIESAYEVRDAADYLIAGQNQLFAAFPYDNYFSRDQLTPTTMPVSVTHTIIDRYNDGEDVQENPFAIAAMDLRQLRAGSASDLPVRVNTLAQTILTNLPAGTTPIPEDNPLLQSLRQAYEAAQKFDYDSSLTIDQTREGYVDLKDFVRQLQADRTVAPEILGAAAAVEAVIRGTASPVVIKARSIREGSYRGNPMDLVRAEGVSIYLPLGERDERPTAVDPNDPACPARPERQLGYYADPNQLRFTRDYPAWAALLLRLEGNVLIRRAPLPDGCSLLNEIDPNDGVAISTLPFRSPVPLQLNRSHPIFLPLLRR